MAFLGQFYNLNLYPEYLHDHMNGTKGEWGSVLPLLKLVPSFTLEMRQENI